MTSHIDYPDKDLSDVERRIARRGVSFTGGSSGLPVAGEGYTWGPGAFGFEKRYTPSPSTFWDATGNVDRDDPYYSTRLTYEQWMEKEYPGKLAIRGALDYLVPVMAGLGWAGSMVLGGAGLATAGELRVATDKADAEYHRRYNNYLAAGSIYQEAERFNEAGPRQWAAAQEELKKVESRLAAVTPGTPEWETAYADFWNAKYRNQQFGKRYDEEMGVPYSSPDFSGEGTGYVQSASVSSGVREGADAYFDWIKFGKVNGFTSRFARFLKGNRGRRPYRRYSNYGGGY